MKLFLFRQSGVPESLRTNQLAIADWEACTVEINKAWRDHGMGSDELKKSEKTIAARFEAKWGVSPFQLHLTSVADGCSYSVRRESYERPSGGECYWEELFTTEPVEGATEWKVAG
jgi:hypothetical protein